MNGFAVVLCMSVLGVQQTWRTTPEGQLEYVLQVEPTFLASLEQGESITSDLPATAKEVHRLCLRISAGDLKKARQWKLEVPPLATAEERAAKSEPDIPVAIIVDENGASRQSTDVSHGWQAMSDGRVKYVVQLAPALLERLQEGDEIYMNLYPEAGQIEQFIITAGANVLPRKSAKGPAHATLSSKNSPLTSKNHRTVTPVAAEKESAPIYGPVAETPPGEAQPASRNTARPFAPRTTEPAKLRNPPRFSVTDEQAEQPAEEPMNEQPLYGQNEVPSRGAAPDLVTETQPEETLVEEQPWQPSSVGGKHGHRTLPPREAPEEEVPQFDGREFNQDQFAGAPVNSPRTTPAAFPKTRAGITPPGDDNEYLPDTETRNSRRPNSFSSTGNHVVPTSGEENREGVDNNRTASIPPRGKSSLSAGDAEPAKNTSRTEKAEQPEATLGMWAFVCCALFLSIGGNLYLGWTTAEFYQRYRQVLERSRGSSRSSDED